MKKKNKIYDILLAGSGLSSLTFAEEYTKTNKRIDIISGNLNNKDLTNNYKFDFNNILPPQFKNKFIALKKYFYFNKLNFDKKNCNIFGTMEFGGISNYWGMQVDRNISYDLGNLTKKTQNIIKKNFLSLIENKKFMGNYLTYKSNYKLDKSYEEVIDTNKLDKTFLIEKPILAISNKKKKIMFSDLKEKSILKLTPHNLKFKLGKKITIHNYLIEKIEKKGKLINLHCINDKNKKIFTTKKLVLGCGTLATTKLILDFLNIHREIAIKHHPRLVTMYFAKKKLLSNLNFTPGVMQIRHKTNNYLADLRPSNKWIIDRSIEIFSFLKPLKSFFYKFKNNLIFSNLLLNSSFSNLYIKKNKELYYIYSKKTDTLNKLKKSQKRIFDLLKSKNIILPFYKNYFSGFGSDYHYFGTMPVNSKSAISINENCQLKKEKSIYIIDGSIFNFKKNFFPMGIIMANSKRIAKLIKK